MEITEENSCAVFEKVAKCLQKVLGKIYKSKPKSVMKGRIYFLNSKECLTFMYKLINIVGEMGKNFTKRTISDNDLKSGL